MATPTAEIGADMKMLATDVYLTPAYFSVGLTDLAVERMREANLFDPIEYRRQAGFYLRRELAAQAEKVVKQAQQAPATLLQHGRRLSEAAKADYDVLAERGEQVIERIRGQRATRDLLTRLDNTMAITRGAMSTAGNAFVQSQRVAVATLKTGTDEAENVAATLAGTARGDVEVTRTSLRRATAHTKAAATRTCGMANAAAKNTSSPQATATSTRKNVSKPRAGARGAA